MRKIIAITCCFLLLSSDLMAAAATMYVTVSGAGDKSGSSWANAMGLGEFETDVDTAVEAGDIYYVAGGTYTFTDEFYTASDGTTTSPIKIIGVKSGTTNEAPVYSDWAFGTDRPYFAMGDYYFYIGDYWEVQNIRGDGTGGNYMLQGTLAFSGINLKMQNLHTSSTRGGISTSNNSNVVACEASSYFGSGIVVTAYSNVAYCYVHEAKDTGIRLGHVGTTAVNNVVETSGIGIGITDTRDGMLITGNSIRNCTSGILANDSNSVVIVNNIIADCIDGAKWTTAQSNQIVDYNCWYGNTTDVTNIAQGNNKVTTNPTFTSGISKGTDGATDAAGTAFTSVSNPFSGVTTNDFVLIHSGTGVTVGVYDISAVVDSGEITLGRSAGASASSIVFGILKGNDFTVGSGSSVLDVGMTPQTLTGVTGDYKHNIGADQDDNTAGGSGGTAIMIITTE